MNVQASPQKQASRSSSLGGSKHTSYDIAFNSLTFSVTDRATGNQKVILDGVSGLASAGRLLSIMGASGAGKTTLLDTLAGNRFSGTTVSGEILVNGKPWRRAAFSRMSCYVQQKDVLPAASTVREAIATSAFLRLPLSVGREAKRQAVEDVLKELDLLGCADTLIGDEVIGLKGISGGQKRRVSVGVELVKDPKIIFLDEPTSGLDSEMARGLIDLLVGLARRSPQRTVVCTIHQPSSDITEAFDDFLLLAKGRVVYGGVWQGALDHFEACGYKCPTYKNPTDYFMAVIKDPDAADALTQAYDKRRPECLAEQRRAAARSRLAHLALPSSTSHTSSKTLLPGIQSSTLSAMTPSGTVACGASQYSEGGDAGNTTSTANGGGDGAHVALDVVAMQQGATEEAVQGVQAVQAVHAEEDDKVDMEVKSAVPMWYQAGVLIGRNWRNWLRNPIMLSSELIQYIFLALFIGLMYMRFSSNADKGSFDRAACIWFAFAILCFTPSYTAVTNWDRERHLLKRELKQKQYSVISYYIARYAVLIPFEAVQCAVFTAIMYFMAGFQADFAKFMTFFGALAMFQVISEGIGLVCGVITRQATYAIILLTFILLVLLSFSGFLTSEVPVYFRWASDASYLTYSFSALLQSEFDGLKLKDDAGQLVNPNDYLPDTVSGGLSFAKNMGILASQMVGMEIIKIIALLAAERFDLM